MPSTINSDNGVSSGTSGIKTTGGNDGILTFQSSGTETMRIDASGNVGVGVTPADKFQVRKGTNQNLLVGAAATLSSGCKIESINDAYTANVGLEFRGSDFAWLSTGTERMRLDSSGNLLVGTTTAIGRATVVGGSTSQFAFHDGNGGNTNYGYLNYGGSNGELTLNATSSGGNTYIRLFTSNSGTNAERARIDNSGNLLVGATSTTWSGSRLTSAGTVSIASGASINLSSTVCGGAIVSVYVAGSGNGGLFFLNYSANAVKIAGDGSATDTGTDFAVYKNAASHTSTLKNKSGATQTFSVVVVAGQLS